MDKERKALVLGAGGFIGHHLVKRLHNEGFWVRGVDLKVPEYSASFADNFMQADLRTPQAWEQVCDQPFDEIYQLAADMGGAGYIFTGKHDADIMHNSVLINLHALEYAVKSRSKRIFFSSSACIYPTQNQQDILHPTLSEASAYPAAPDSEYGWEKIFSERLYLAYSRNYDLEVRIARFHNVFGPEGVWNGGKEKAPAAICRKIAQVADGGSIEIWGDGEQTRSFLYIDECLEGIRRLMTSNFTGPVNIGSEEMVSINDVAYMVMDIAGKRVSLDHIPGPLGVRGRTSDNRLIQEQLQWAPNYPLKKGLEKTYKWIVKQLEMQYEAKQ